MKKLIEDKLVFCKLLGSQESGYSGDKPGKRGKYILIPKEAWNFFPELNKNVLNDVVGIHLISSKGTSHLRNYIWQNAKYHLSEKNRRAHDERRIYRSQRLENDLKLDRNVFIVFFQGSDRYEFFVLSVKPDQEKEWNELKALLKGKRSVLVSLKNSPYMKDKFDQNFSFSLKDLSFNVDKEFLSFMKSYGNKILNSESSFVKDDWIREGHLRELVFLAYGEKCALSRDIYSIKVEDPQVSYIRPLKLGGKLLPSNGICISKNYSDFFNKGLWTLSDDARVIVHDRAKDLMNRFNGKQIFPLISNSLFNPDSGNCRYHRENIFGSFAK